MNTVPQPDPAKDPNRSLEEQPPSGGAASVDDELFASLYRELRRMARESLREERPGNVLQTTALVHEAYVSLAGRGAHYRDRAHFYSVAARVMRRILVEEARRQQAAKHRPGEEAPSLDELDRVEGGIDTPASSPADLVALDLALEKLGRSFGRKCTVVELRFFVGLTLEETAEVLEISRATVKRDWEFTRDWLRREMREQASDGD